MKSIKRLLIVGVMCVMSSGLVANGAAPEQVKLAIFAGAVGMESQLLAEAIQIYAKEHPGIEIVPKPAQESATTRLTEYRKYLTDESDRKTVDIYQIDVIWPGEIGRHFADLGQYGAAEAAKEHFPALIQNNTVDGKLIAMPWFTDAGLLFYRTDLLQKYGFAAPPQTWDELETMAKKIQDGEVTAGKENFWGFVWQGGKYEGLTCDALEWIASSGGGTFIDPNKTVTLNNPNALKALERAAKWVGFISPPAVTGFMEEDARRWWQSGNAAFMRNWPYAYKLGQADDSPIKGKIGVCPIPGENAGQSAASLGGWQLAVSKYSKNPKVAAEVALYLASAAEQKRRAMIGSYSPTIMSLYKDADVLKAVPFYESLYNVFINAVARPSTATAPKYNEVSTLFFTAVHSAITGEKDAKTAIEELELDLQDLMAKK